MLSTWKIFVTITVITIVLSVLNGCGMKIDMEAGPRPSGSSGGSNKLSDSSTGFSSNPSNSPLNGSLDNPSASPSNNPSVSPSAKTSAGTTTPTKSDEVKKVEISGYKMNVYGELNPSMSEKEAFALQESAVKFIVACSKGDVETIKNVATEKLHKEISEYDPKIPYKQMTNGQLFYDELLNKKLDSFTKISYPRFFDGKALVTVEFSSLQISESNMSIIITYESNKVGYRISDTVFDA